VESSINIDLPSTWQKFRPGLCEGCWAGCCTLPVEVTLEDLVRMELATEDETRGSLRKLAGRLTRAGIVRSFRARSRLFVLEQKNNGDCLFLDAQRRCTIYDKRPEVCRQFPSIGPRPGYCPGLRRSARSVPY
jgi:Fe-S-cluster containining protein